MAIDTLGANALASDSVTTAKIADDAVTAAKIPAGAVVADIADGSITTAKIADDAVTGAKIENSPSIANGLTLTDGDLVFASGHGISFAADASSTATGATTSSEILHDYEEGTFQPLCNFTGGAPSAGKTQGFGQYTKIGRQVHLHFRLTNINVTGASGDIQIQNMPFTSLLDSGDGAVSNTLGSAKTNHVNFAASSFTLSSATTEFTNPQSRASFEDKTLFVSISSIALFFPIDRGK